MSFGRRPGGAGGPFGSPPNDFPQVDKRTIDSFIDQFSSAIKYWKAIQCPCMNERSGQPDLACAECRGLGWFYADRETDQKFIRAMVHSRRSEGRNQKGGRIVNGYVSITFLPGVFPGEGDLVQVCKDREVINEEFHTYGAVLRDGSTAETLRFRDVTCVEMVAIHDESTKKASFLSKDQYAFNPAGRKIDFSIPISAGTRYSVRYIAVPEYIVKAETMRAVSRVMHDDGLPNPARTRDDIVYPYNVQAVRLDRAILQRQRGAVDFTTKSTFNNSKGRGPFS